MLLQNGLISREEFQKRIDLLPRYASKTLGIAFMESDEVAFRDKKPSLEVVLHELGHCFFKKGDHVWSAVYTGGEYLMWLILKDLKKALKALASFWAFGLYSVKPSHVPASMTIAYGVARCPSSQSFGELEGRGRCGIKTTLPSCTTYFPVKEKHLARSSQSS